MSLPTESLRQSVVVSNGEMGPLPGYGVLKELKTVRRFDQLKKDLHADSTPSLEGSFHFHSYLIHLIHRFFGVRPTDNEIPQLVVTSLSSARPQAGGTHAEPNAHAPPVISVAAAAQTPTRTDVKSSTLEPPPQDERRLEESMLIPIKKPEAVVGANFETPHTVHATTAGVSKTLRQVHDKLSWAPWAIDIERVVSQNLISSMVDSDARKIKWLDASASLGAALRYLKENSVGGVPIFRGSEPIEILELSDIAGALVRTRRPSYSELLEGVQDTIDPVLNLPCGQVLGATNPAVNSPSSWWLSSDDLASEVVRAFATQGRWRVAVYSNNDTILSTVLSQHAFLSSILKQIGPSTSLKKIKAHSVGIFVPNVFCVHSDASAGLVFASMVKKGISGVGVVKHERLIGQVSLDDLVLVEEDPHSLDQSIKKFCQLGNHAHPPVTVSPSISLYELLEVFVRTHAHRVFAVSNMATKEILGIATLSSFYRLLVGGAVETQPHLRKTSHQVVNVGKE